MSHPTDGLVAALASRTVPLAVVGLGYVGLPLAVCLAKKFSVIGFDINEAKIDRLRRGIDETREVASAALTGAGIAFTSDGADLAKARFIIVAVPTPVDEAKRPDLRPLTGSSTTVGKHLQRGTVVVYESTVYPGATEEACVPVLEAQSGLRAGVDFTFGYSPERINPGDKQHTIDQIMKVVSGSDAQTAQVVADVYGAVITAGTFRAASVKVAEAAKVIENTQRDLNIALVNELALIFHRLGIDTLDVLEAAGTKWNFLKFRPGLVGGHCIGVDPYYLTHKAESVGYHPQVILAGRRINDAMGAYVARECVRLMIQQDRQVKGGRVLILGLTFKEDIPDVRNTKVIDIVNELRRYGVEPVVIDPVADPGEAMHEYGIRLEPMVPLPKAQAVIAAVAHARFKAISFADFSSACGDGAPFLDIKSAYDRSEIARAGFIPWRL
ncbi:MAG: nucleotide sugar dehydrogenase [Planctomycetes bacterium]|nr:nucleotide sugar dehydrogenase [Planctomycetota bacterium]